MRNKFSELIKSGIASFNYTPLAHETPCSDLICIEYNNVFGPAMGTRMTMLEDGTRLITGHKVKNEEEFTSFARSSRWNGVDFTRENYNCLNEFLCLNNLTYKHTIVNGELSIAVVEYQEPVDEK